MSKITLQKISTANQNLSKLVSLENDFLLARALAKLIQAFDTDAKLIEKHSKEVFDKYAEKNDKGEFVVSPEKTEKFLGELNKFLDTEVELDFQPIDEKLLEGIKLSAREYMALSPFLKEVKAIEIKKKQASNHPKK